MPLFKKINKGALSSSCLLILFLLSPKHADCAIFDSPEKAVKSFINATQKKDIETAFFLDIKEQDKIIGKFRSEIEDLKNYYANSFSGNPSSCPTTNGSPPCDSIKINNMVTMVRLLVPESSNYEILESVFTNKEKTESRVLLKVTYSKENPLIFVDNLKAIQVYHGGVTPIPPIYSDSGILTKDNIFFTIKEVGGGGNYKFPFVYDQREIKETIIEAVTKKQENDWKILNLIHIENKIIFNANKNNDTTYIKMPIKENQTWSGFYMCSQGETSLDLKIREISQNRIHAIFDFNYKNGKGTGEFNLTGIYNSDSRKLIFAPGEWIRNPNNAISVGMEGYISEDGKKYVGTITSSRCKDFYLTLDQ